MRVKDVYKWACVVGLCLREMWLHVVGQQRTRYSWDLSPGCGADSSHRVKPRKTPVVYLRACTSAVCSVVIVLSRVNITYKSHSRSSLNVILNTSPRAIAWFLDSRIKHNLYLTLPAAFRALSRGNIDRALTKQDNSTMSTTRRDDIHWWNIQIIIVKVEIKPSDRQSRIELFTATLELRYKFWVLKQAT